MELLNLFWVFFKIGLFSFGGGYGMLPLIQSEATSMGWITEGQFLNFLAVSEATPGPIAINMATFIGSSQQGILGSICATIGVITPSIIIILLIVAVFKNFLKYKAVDSVLNGIKPVIVGLIFTTGLYLAIQNFLPNIGNLSLSGFNLTALIVTLSIGVVYLAYKLIFKKHLSPILLILLSAGVGMIVF